MTYIVLSLLNVQMMRPQGEEITKTLCFFFFMGLSSGPAGPLLRYAPGSLSLIPSATRLVLPPSGGSLPHR
jgi:hypothetical protein